MMAVRDGASVMHTWRSSDVGIGSREGDLDGQDWIRLMSSSVDTGENNERGDEMTGRELVSIPESGGERESSSALIDAILS